MVSTQPPRLLTFWWQWERIWMWICLLLSFHTSYHYTLCDHFILHIISYYVIISYHLGCWPFGDNGWESGWEFAFCRHFILHIFICDISYFITFHTMWSFPTRLSTFWWQWVRMWTEKVKMGARLSDVLFRLVSIIFISINTNIVLSNFCPRRVTLVWWRFYLIREQASLTRC